MRLGTKSCAECRRRKVRCIFANGSSVCQACTLHGVPCQAQRPKARGASQESSSESLQRRVQELESLVRRIHDSIDSSPKAGGGAASGAEVGLFNLGSDESGDAHIHKVHAGDGSRSSAPLAQLLREATLIGESDGYLDDDECEASPSDRRQCPVLQSVNLDVPGRHTLQSIFTQTKPYWSMWPTCYYGSEPHESLQSNQQSEVEEYLLQTLSDKDTSLSYCKALLWLALCVQQLRADWIDDNFPPQATRQTLVESYLKYTTIALAVAEDESVDVIQCYLLQFKLYINMGRPRRAWTCTRNAVSSAIGLGLHRLGGDISSSYLNIAWSQSWRSERQLSLLLGLPTCVNDPALMSYEHIPDGLSLPQRILYKVSIASAQVIVRDQDYRNAKYSTTVEIDQDLEDIRKLMPDAWWEPYESNATLTDMYFPELAKFMYFFLVKLVHLPYMLKSVNDKRYEPSRTSTLDAAREQIRSYLRMRNFPGAEIIMCEVMDFGAFSAGVALILGASYMPNGGGVLETLTEDGSLVQGLIMSLQQTSDLLECRVAEQGARVLELLTDRRRGGIAAAEVAVPYFGKLNMKWSKFDQSTSPPSAPSAASMTPISSCGGQDGLTVMNPQYDTVNTVQFCTSEFVSGLPPQFGQGDELCEDWFRLMEVDEPFEWQETLTRLASR